MHVGILTFHNGPNYGGHFQALGMAQAISAMGHDVETIHYKNELHYRGQLIKPWVYRRPLKLWHDWLKHREFDRAVKELPLSSGDLAIDPSKIDWNRYDAIVVGSDIVWNRSILGLGRDEVYFGRFPTEFKGRLIAYAPSIGPMPIDYECPSWMPEALGRFSFIGARDPNTASFVELHTGNRPPIVADPTWLVDPVAPSGGRKDRIDDRILVYSFPLVGPDKKFAEAIQSFASENGLKIDVTGYYQGWGDRNLGSVSPDRWQRMFGTYRYIASGTFHGGLFSIREEAQFCIITHPAIDTKLEQALKVTQLEDRLIQSPEAIAETLRQSIDFEKVRPLRQSYADQSLALLADALS